MELLENPVRAYAWGSRTVIAELLGEQVPSPHPQAELWFGAHPADPSHLVRRRRQPAVPARRGARRPRAAARPVPAAGAGTPRCRSCSRCWPPTSRCRCRPTPASSRPRAGFAREDAAGIPRDAADRNYRDANHKPELICALTEFHALVGFRDPADHRAAAARARRCPSWPAHTELLAGRARPRRPARAVHHVDHAAAVGARHAGARPAGRLRPAGAGNGEPSASSRPRRAPRWSSPSATRVTPGCWPRCCSTGSHSRRGRRCTCPPGNLHAYLSGRRHRADGQLRQRAARRADAQARRRPRAAAGARLHRRPAAGDRPAGPTATGSATTPRPRSSCSAAGRPTPTPAPRPSRCPTAVRGSCSAPPGAACVRSARGRPGDHPRPVAVARAPPTPASPCTGAPRARSCSSRATRWADPARAAHPGRSRLRNVCTCNGSGRFR